jgi:hypothetical protein
MKRQTKLITTNLVKLIKLDNRVVRGSADKETGKPHAYSAGESWATQLVPIEADLLSAIRDMRMMQVSSSRL